MAKREPKPLPKRKNMETPGWLLTFGDLNSLLLTFFVLLLSLSTIDRERTSKAMISLERAFGIQIGTWSVEPAPAKVDGITKTGAFDFPAFRAHEYQRKIDEAVKKTDLGEFVDVESGPGGILLRLKSEILFDAAGMNPGGEGLAFLGRLGDIIKDSPYEVFVEAHTDDRPIHTDSIRDNWDLSARRATRVAGILEKFSGIDPSRMGAVGYGESRPRVPNVSDENRRMNRRVEILLREPQAPR
ncbi:MAG: OmpA family protein [Nitrospirae bacterium]|nr:OmpA family protein [Nitrospirota bacterium]